MTGSIPIGAILPCGSHLSPEAQIARYVRLYGTRSDILLQDVRRLADLGICFGADLYVREVEFLRDTEWAETAEDIIWRRSKLGLRLTTKEIAALDAYLRGA